MLPFCNLNFITFDFTSLALKSHGYLLLNFADANTTQSSQVVRRDREPWVSSAGLQLLLLLVYVMSGRYHRDCSALPSLLVNFALLSLSAMLHTMLTNQLRGICSTTSSALCTLHTSSVTKMLQDFSFCVISTLRLDRCLATALLTTALRQRTTAA